MDMEGVSFITRTYSIIREYRLPLMVKYTLSRIKLWEESLLVEEEGAPHHRTKKRVFLSITLCQVIQQENLKEMMQA